MRSFYASKPFSYGKMNVFFSTARKPFLHERERRNNGDVKRLKSDSAERKRNFEVKKVAKKPSQNLRDNKIARQLTVQGEQYPSMIIELSKSGEGEEAYRVFEEARIAGLELANGPLFAELFGVFARKGMALEALKTLNKMQQAEVFPTTHQMGLVMDAILKDDKVPEMKERLDSISDMTQSVRWKADVEFHKKLMWCYASISDKFETVDAVISLLKKVKIKPMEKMKEFTVMLTAFGEKGSHKQLKVLFKACAELKIVPDTRVFIALMKGLAKSKEYNEFFSIFDQMRTTYPELLDKYILTLVLRTCYTAREFSRAAEIVKFLETTPARMEWDLPLMNELMLIASHTSNAGVLVKQVMEEMKLRNIEMDVNTYNLRIGLHARLREIDKAFEVAAEMKKSAVEFNNITMTELLTACRAAADAERAFDLFQSAKQTIPPDNEIHISILQSIFTRCKRFDLERKWREELDQWKKENVHSIYDGPKPYKKREFKESLMLTEQQLLKAKRVSPSRKKFQQRAAAAKKSILSHD